MLFYSRWYLSKLYFKANLHFCWKSVLFFFVKTPVNKEKKKKITITRRKRAEETLWKIQTGQKRKMSTKSVENVERSTWFLIKAKIQYLFLVSWDAPLRLLSSHSSVLMLNFQNFYITKGPTTSAEKYPASTKSVSQPRPCRGETLLFHQLSAVTESERGGTFPFLSLFWGF